MHKPKLRPEVNEEVRSVERFFCKGLLSFDERQVKITLIAKQRGVPEHALLEIARAEEAKATVR